MVQIMKLQLRRSAVFRTKVQKKKKKGSVDQKERTQNKGNNNVYFQAHVSSSAIEK